MPRRFAVLLTLEFNLGNNADGWYSDAIVNAVPTYLKDLHCRDGWLEVKVVWGILFGFGVLLVWNVWGFLKFHLQSVN